MATAPPAQAAIRSGWYTHKLYGRDDTVVLTYAAHVVGNKMYATADETWYDIHPTSRGGWILALDNDAPRLLAQRATGMRASPTSSISRAIRRSRLESP